MLALDFDGVVCDALTECAAVTWHAARGTSVPVLSAAIPAIPEEFMRTFASVRSLSRTLDDFMVANLLPPGSTVDRRGFEEQRSAAGEQRLAALAAVGETARRTWRSEEFDQWIALHTVYPEVAELMRRVESPVVIVSAKDADSIREILDHHGLAENVDRIFGLCHDKQSVVAGLGESLTFIDDNLRNATDVAKVPGVQSFWARWGYHSDDDLDLAAELEFPALELNNLNALLTPAEL